MRIGIVLAIVLGAIVIAVTTSLGGGAQPSVATYYADSNNTLNQRVKNASYIAAVNGAYPDIKRMNLVTDSLWVCPDSMWYQYIYCARFTNLKIQTRNGDTMTIPLDSLVGYPLDVKRLYKRGTDSLSWVNKIFLIGIRR